MKFSHLCLGFLVLSAVACKKDKEIKVYRVAKEQAPSPQPAPAGDPHAGVPGMMPGGTMTGGTKAGGDPHAGLTADQLAAVGPASGPKVTDAPAAGWTKQPSTSIRQLSYRVDGEGGATTDISLVILRGAAGAVLDNVNRWRSQLGQPAIDQAALKQSSQAFTTSVGEAVVVEIEGLAPGADALKDGRMVGAIVDNGADGWFFKMRGNSAITAAQKAAFLEWVKSAKPAEPSAVSPAPAKKASVPDSLPSGDGSLAWEAPVGWTLAPASGSMRYATFTVTDAAGAKAEMAITHFPGDVGGDLDNVNRWRNQVSLAPVDSAGLGALVTSLTAGPKSLSVVDLTGPDSRMVAAWTRHGKDTWFFKFTGPDALIAVEKAKFTAFLESIRFTKPE